jgi:MerR family transcriptional regulator, repressor of the yfmOP operon
VSDAARTLRIGEVARAAGTTVRTVRYYEEIGLLPVSGDRVSGSHRLYGDEDVERLCHLLRLKDLLGVTLEELRQLVDAEDARPALRREFRADGTPPRRRSAILRRALADVQRQQELVERRRAQLDALDAELEARRARILARLDETAAGAARR